MKNNAAGPVPPASYYGQNQAMPSQTPVPMPGAAPGTAGVPHSAPAPNPATLPNQVPVPGPVAAPVPTYIPAGAPQDPSNNSEVFFGGKVVGIIAAVLVLAGLGLLGASFIPQLPDAAKAAFIFLFAAIFTGGGAFLVHKSRNVFAYALFVSGMAAFFVAIWVSWAHFGLFTQPVALAVSGVWMAVTVGLILFTRTWPLSLTLAVLAGLFGTTFLEGPSSQLLYGPSNPVLLAVSFILVALYIVALGVVGMKLAIDEAGPDNARLQSVRTKSLASFFVSEFALFAAGAGSNWHYSMDLVLVLVGIVLVAIMRAPLPALVHRSQTVWRVNEIVVCVLAALGFLSHDIAGGASDVHTIVSYGLFTIAVLVVAGLRVFDRTRADVVPQSTAIPVLFSLAVSGVFVNYLCGVAFDDVSPYVWSALAIVCSLVMITVAFWLNDKALRLCGLVLTLLCILKIAVLDFSGDALSQAIALVVAGLVCFGISALYTYASKRLL